MSFSVPWGTPFYAGGGASALVPTVFEFAIAGRNYMIDSRNGNGITVGDIPVQRAQADTNADPSEATLSTEGLWRRTIQSWHEGSAQAHYDRQDSSPNRYAASSGIDPWTRNQLSLLKATTLSRTSGNTNLWFAVAAGRLYVSDGQVVRYTTDLLVWTAITGNPAQTITGMATDGNTVYVGYGTSGVYTIASGAGAMASYATGTASNVGYAKGRLLVVEGSGASPRVYNVTAAGAITSGTLLLTAPGAVFPNNQWVAGGPSAIYLVAAVGSDSRVWRTAVKADGTALDAPVIAGEIPEGQSAKSVVGYLGSLLLVGAADRVWVFGLADNQGNLARLGYIETTAPCYAFEPQDRFVWYGTASATLARMALDTNVATRAGDVVPGHADDLVAALSGDVQSIATFAGGRCFTVSGRGVYAETGVPVLSGGTLETGLIGFGIGDLKNALFADIRFHPLTSQDTITVEVAKDGGAYDIVGVLNAVGSVSGSVSLGQLLAENVAVRLTLTGNPVVTMLTVLAVPAPTVGETMRVPLLLFHEVTDVQGNTQTVDVPAERSYLRDLREARTAVTVQDGTELLTGIVDRLVEWKSETRAQDGTSGWLGYHNGTLTVDIKIVR